MIRTGGRTTSTGRSVTSRHISKRARPSACLFACAKSPLGPNPRSSSMTTMAVTSPTETFVIQFVNGVRAGIGPSPSCSPYRRSGSRGRGATARSARSPSSTTSRSTSAMIASILPTSTKCSEDEREPRPEPASRKSSESAGAPLRCHVQIRHEPSRSPRPTKYPQRAQGVPAAGPAFALVHVELEIADPGVDHFALAWILERQPPFGVTLGTDQVDGFGHARIGRHARLAEAVEPAQRVVVPAGREREQREGPIDQLAARQPAQHPAFEQVFLPSLKRRAHLGRAPHRALVLQKALEDVDRRMERS